MNLKEYNEVKSLSYQQYCEYLKKKYGMVPYKYGDERNHKLGLYIHHIGEDKIPGLSSREAQIAEDGKYQLPDMLCYCDYLEHFLLHLKIGEIGADSVILAMAGLETWIKPALTNFFDYGKKNLRVDEEYYNLIKDDRDVFELLMQKHNALVKEQDYVFDHNATLFLQLEEMRTNKGRALVVLGTGLGKTTTGLGYLKKHNIRALVLGPNNLIKNGWDNYPEYCDTRTYQAFSNIYEKIDYSKYGCVILDEAHHAAYDEETERGAETWGKAINYLINNGIKVLGLTATPDRTDGLSLGETLFKDCTCKGLSVEEGIENGILHPFSYITSIYDKDGIIKDLPDAKYKNDEKYVKLRGQLDLALNNLPTVPDTLLKYMPHNNRKGIIFVQDIEDRNIALEIFRKAFPQEEVRFLHSKQIKEEQDKSREWFKKTTRGYLRAVNMITEGAHYEGVNTLIRFRRTESYLLYTQQLGRIITLTTKKDPKAIVFDLVNNINSIRYNDRISSRNKEPANKGVLKVLREIANSKSAQIIIANEAQNIIDCLEELKNTFRPYNYWSDEEKDILKNNYKKGIYFLMQLLPNRTKTMIKNQLRKCGLRAKVADWSDNEIEILKQYYSAEGKENISKRLPNRTPTACELKAHQLGLSYRPLVWTTELINILKQYYPEEGAVGIQKRLPSTLTKSAIQTKAYELGIKYNYLSKDWTTEEINILTQYYPIEGMKVRSRLNRTDTSIKNKVFYLKLKHSNGTKVRCIETGEIFNSITQADKAHPGANNLKKVIEGKSSFAGRLPDGTKLHWEYVSSNCPKEAAVDKTQDLKSCSSRVWSPNEIEDLKNDKELSTRSAKACTQKCRELGIYHHIYRPNTRYWTAEENEIIKKYYPIEGQDCCKRLPNRSVSAIVCHASKLGIQSCREASKFMATKCSKKVRCIETGEVFNSISQANKTYPGASNLKKVIDGERSFAGRLPDGTPLHWEYIKDSDNN